jgi:hypothetical protein
MDLERATKLANILIAALNSTQKPLNTYQTQGQIELFTYLSATTTASALLINSLSEEIKPIFNTNSLHLFQNQVGIEFVGSHPLDSEQLRIFMGFAGATIIKLEHWLKAIDIARRPLYEDREDFHEVLTNMNIGIVDWKDRYCNSLYVVIGKSEFDKTLLFETLKYPDKIVFFSQEDFFNFILQGEFPSYHTHDPRIKEHAGLEYLTSIGFRWPELKSDKTNSNLSNSDFDYDLSPESCIARLGYNVRQDTSVNERRNALLEAINPDKCGFEKVVRHLAYLVRRDSHNFERREANNRRLQDLLWLKNSFYKPPYTFLWPDDY